MAEAAQRSGFDAAKLKVHIAKLGYTTDRWEGAKAGARQQQK